MKSINADKVIKTINWIANDDNSDSLLQPFKKDDVYVCEIYLPLIEKTIIGIGDSKVDSINNAAEQTSKLIDEYLSKNPTTSIKDYFGGKQYILEEDDNGNITIRLKDKKYC